MFQLTQLEDELFHLVSSHMLEGYRLEPREKDKTAQKLVLLFSNGDSLVLNVVDVK